MISSNLAQYVVALSDKIEVFWAVFICTNRLYKYFVPSEDNRYYHPFSVKSELVYITETTHTHTHTHTHLLSKLANVWHKQS